MAPAQRRLVFCFDVCCPYAYLAAQRVPALAAAAGLGPGELEWRPTLLGGLYEATEAPQGKDGSATQVMPANKQAMLARDLRREAERHQVALNWNARHPIRTINALRLLCGVEDPGARERLALAMYQAYWVQGEDLADREVLQRIASAQGVTEAEARMDSEASKTALRENTDWAVAKGAFGVPSFVASSPAGEERLFFGQDRMFFVARHLGLPDTHPLGSPARLRPARPGAGAATLSFFHDFSSPWSFLGSKQVRALAQEHNAKLVYRPILLGALFRSIGTPNAPMLAISPAKRAYGALDMGDWCNTLGVKLTFPDGFPIRTVLPLRISIVEPRVIDAFYAAAWVQGRNIGDEDVLHEVLSEAGFDANDLVRRAQSAEVKNQLRENTEEAIRKGACGVPTFQVGADGELVWGQDRIHVVSDMLADAAAAAKL